MILIDATYINIGGGKVLLDLLIEEIIKKNIKAFFLLDYRISKKYTFINDENKYSIKPSIIDRHLFYLKNKQKFKTVLCFANVPPTINLSSKVYTFFQNVDLLKNFSFKTFLKMYFIKMFIKNSDGWIVQTENVAKLIQHKGIDTSKIYIYPFFKEFSLKSSIKEYNRFKYLYVSSGEKHKNHNRLLNAFEKYHSINNNAELILTLDKKYDYLYNKIEFLKKKGIPIKNLGIISKELLHKQYLNVDFIIYPSLYESFGLGLVEACQYNIPILASNKEYVKEITDPLITFDPKSEKSILIALIESKKTFFSKSNLKVENKINKIVNLLTKNK